MFSLVGKKVTGAGLSRGGSFGGYGGGLLVRRVVTRALLSRGGSFGRGLWGVLNQVIHHLALLVCLTVSALPGFSCNGNGVEPGGFFRVWPFEDA
jgi:hypothetical protein